MTKLKMYMLLVVNDETGCLDTFKATTSKQHAINELQRAIRHIGMADITLHEIEFDPSAGYQTVNICQISETGKRHDMIHTNPKESQQCPAN